jgi:hypothetical protein
MTIFYRLLHPTPAKCLIQIPKLPSYCNKNPILYSKKRTTQPQSQFPRSCIFERFIYSQDRSTYFPAADYADRSWEYLNRSQTHMWKVVLGIGNICLNFFRYCVIVSALQSQSQVDFTQKIDFKTVIFSSKGYTHYTDKLF